MTRALFLDFDGVLHPAGGRPGTVLPFEYLPVLEGLLSDAPDIRIVVHSSWSERYSVEELREFLGVLGDRVIGAVRPGPKGAAILQFVRENGIDEWLAIDDDPAEFPDFLSGRLVLCPSLQGLCALEVQNLLRSWIGKSSA